MAVREIENFDFLRGRRVAASGCSLEPRTSFSSASDVGCKTKPAKNRFKKYKILCLEILALLISTHPYNILFQVKFLCDCSDFLSTGSWLKNSHCE